MTRYSRFLFSLEFLAIAIMCFLPTGNGVVLAQTLPEYQVSIESTDTTSMTVSRNLLRLAQVYMPAPPDTRRRRPIPQSPPPQNYQEEPPVTQPPISENSGRYENGVRTLEEKTREFCDAMIRGDLHTVLSFYDRNMTRYFSRTYPSWSFIENDALNYFSRWSDRTGNLMTVYHVGRDPESGGELMRLVYRYSYTNNTGRRFTGVSSNDIVWTTMSGTPKIKSIREHVDRNAR